MKTTEFVQTKEYKKFSEFCKACHQDKNIGLCFGQAGVGKTESARYYTKWGKILPLIKKFPETVPFSMLRLNSVLYTPGLLDKPRDIFNAIKHLTQRFSHLKERSLYGLEIPGHVREKNQNFAELVLIDESERLKPQAFELIRELYDTYNINFVFIGMPGIDRILERFPQLYSRIGFMHQFQRLSKIEIEFIIEKHFSKLGVTLDEADFTDQQAISAIIRCTNGNFRLINRLLKQALRIMKVNHVTTLTSEIIEAARSCLLIGEK